MNKMNNKVHTWNKTISDFRLAARSNQSPPISAKLCVDFKLLKYVHYSTVQHSV